MVPCRYPLSLSRFLPRDTLTLFYCSPFIFQIVYAYYSSCEFMLLLLRLDSCKFNQHSKFISFTWSYSYSTSFPSFFFCIEFSLQKPIFRNWKQKECQSSTLTVFDKFDLAGLASSQKVKSSDCISQGMMDMVCPCMQCWNKCLSGRLKFKSCEHLLKLFSFHQSALYLLFE